MKRQSLGFKNSKSELVKEVLGALLLGGMIMVATTSPFFVQNLLRSFKKLKKYPSKKVYDTFYNLKKSGLIDFYEKNNQIYFSLTKKGKSKAGWMQVDDLKVKRPKEWDGKWRVLLFDVVEMKRLYREALRGKLINMGFVMLQKSAWIIPYDCDKEVKTLRSFFSLSEKELRILVIDKMGDDKSFRKYFCLG